MRKQISVETYHSSVAGVDWARLTAPEHRIAAESRSQTMRSSSRGHCAESLCRRVTISSGAMRVEWKQSLIMEPIDELLQRRLPAGAISSASARDHRRRARRQRCGLRHADRRRQEPLLPASRAAARRSDRRRLAADLADGRPGASVAGARRAGAVAEQLADVGGAVAGA